MDTCRPGIIAALALVTTALASASQRPATPPRDTPAPLAAPAAFSSISGRIINAEDGTPLRRVRIAAISSAGQERYALTDDEGRFVLEDLYAGQWYLAASKTGFIRQQFGARMPSDRAVPIPLGEGQSLAVTLSLQRAGAIAGRIYDEFGEPLAGVRVDVLRARMVRQRRYLQRIGDGDLTDDTGAFRVHGLSPGAYYVSASLRMAPADTVIQATHPPTYYPGVGSFAEAQRVVLGYGSDAHVAFPVMPFRAARVSGVVLTSAGSPGDAFLNLTSEADELGTPLGFGAATQADGTFTIPEVPPGSYTLNVSLRGMTGPGAEVAAVPLLVYGEDLAGLAVVTAPPGTIRGDIVAAADVTGRLPSPVQVSARSTRASADATYAESAQGAFELSPPAGPFRLAVEPPEGWSLEAIFVNGVDVTDVPVDLRGQQDAPARIVLTDRVTEVRGTVATGGVPVGIVVFPADASRWAPPSRYVRTVIPDGQGAFRISGLPGARSYLAVAAAALEEGEGDDPEFLAGIRDRATPFELGEGDTRVIELPVVQR